MVLGHQKENTTVRMLIIKTFETNILLLLPCGYKPELYVHHPKALEFIRPEAQGLYSV